MLPVLEQSYLTRTKTRLQDTALHAFYSYNTAHVKSNISATELFTLRKVAKDKTIVVLKPDKGNGVVILNRSEYNSKLLELLTEEGKFEEVGAMIILVPS